MARPDQAPGGLSAGAVSFGLALLDRCEFPPRGSSVVCGVSGGADSSALLVLAVLAGCQPAVVHVDHGIRPTSSADADAVVALAARFGSPAEVVRVSVPAGPNLEARARGARRRSLPAGALLGHTADDQAETLLMNLLRGAGATGLAAMPHDGRRPLLRIRRAETRELCRLADVDPVDDQMNSDPTFTRVRMRTEVVPLLNEVAGRDVVPLLSRTAELMAELADLSDAASAGVDPTDALELAALDRATARSAVRLWLIAETGAAQPFALAEVDRVLDVVSGSVRATEVSGGWRVSRHQQRLRISRPPSGER